MEILLKKALRLPPGVSEPRVIDLLWHTPTGVIDRRATPTVAAGRAGHHRHARGARPQAQAGAARQHARRPTRSPARTTRGRIDLVFFHAERKFIERQLPDGQHPLRQRPHRELQRQEADDASRLHRRARGARRPAAARAGLSADRRALRQGAAEGRPAGAGAGARAARVAGRRLAQAARLARCQRRRSRACTGPQDAADVSPASPPWQRLAYDELLAGPAGAGAGAAEPQVAARPQRRGRRPRPRHASPTRCPSRSPTRSARRSKEIAEDMALAAPHAAAAAGRRRLRQDRGGADGHGDRRGGRRAGRADGADRGAGAPACRDHRAARRMPRACASAC